MNRDDLLNTIKPFVLRWIANAGITSGGGSTTGLSEAIANLFMRTDGSRALEGNLAVVDGVTIDGVDISALASVPSGTRHLNANTAVGATSVTIASPPSALDALTWILIDPFTIEAELRKITSVSGDMASFTGALAYAHAANDNVLFLTNTEVSAIWFGAATGTDSTTAIQRALNQLNGVGGGICLLPAGYYDITTTITIPSWCTLQGVGGRSDYAGGYNKTSRLRWTGAASTTVRMVSLIDTDYGRLLDVNIDGNYLAGVGVDVTGYHIIVRGCMMHNLTKRAMQCIVTSGAGNAGGILIDWNFFQGDGEYGFYADKMNDSWITNNEIGARYSIAGIFFLGTGCDDVIVYGNHVYVNLDGIVISGGRNIIVSNNVVHDNERIGIFIYGSSWGNTVVGNSVNLNGIDTAQSADIRVGIRLQSASIDAYPRGNTITGNTCSNTGTPYITITGSTNANPSVVTTTAAHGLTTGQSVIIADSVTNTAINGTWIVTVLSTTTFSVPVAANGVGTGGNAYRLDQQYGISLYGYARKNAIVANTLQGNAIAGLLNQLDASQTDNRIAANYGVSDNSFSLKGGSALFENAGLDVLADSIVFAIPGYPTTYLSKIRTAMADTGLNQMAFVICDGTSGGSVTPLTIDRNGVGFGTTATPIYPIDVAHATPIARLNLTNTDYYAQLLFHEIGTQNGAINYVGSTNSQTARRLALEIINYRETPIIFYTGGINERMRIEGLGNIVMTSNLTKIRNVATSFPSAQGAADTFLKNDGSGNLTWSPSTFISRVKWGY